MPKLSEQLADLSAHAKHAEDAVSAAQKEAHDKSSIAANCYHRVSEPRGRL